MTERRKPAFTKTEIKTYSAAAREAGMDAWSIEKTAADGSVTRFVCGAAVSDECGQSDWDKHEAR